MGGAYTLGTINRCIVYTYSPNHSLPSLSDNSFLESSFPVSRYSVSDVKKTNLCNVFLQWSWNLYQECIPCIVTTQTCMGIDKTGSGNGDKTGSGNGDKPCIQDVASRVLESAYTLHGTKLAGLHCTNFGEIDKKYSLTLNTLCCEDECVSKDRLSHTKSIKLIGLFPLENSNYPSCIPPPTPVLPTYFLFIFLTPSLYHAFMRNM